ncbi:unnamed protein product [Mytilus edulis]|uniref:EF-hand domain-containing protein n=1 Tax=Mytilus edulis TaxID=6550 RepID=A0A8S3V9D8_MYTED|nr:unnamed protein product [Mytilus edulis]
MEAASRNRRIRFKSYTRPKSEPAKPPQKDEFDDEFLDLGDSDYSSSDSTSSDDENQSLSFPGNHSVKHSTILCQQVYVKSCRYFDKVPSTYFFRRLKRTHIDLSHHGLGIDGVKSVAIALVSNTTVQRLNISNNDIASEGLAHILQTLQENIVITDLNLSNNNLSTGGAVLLDGALSNNRIITKLDISANGFTEADAVPLSNLVKKNQSIRTLSLSKNSFREEGGIVLGKALECNDTITYMDLSWNHLRQRGAVSLCYCLQINNTIESINLAWNGFGMEGCYEMGKTLLNNRTITELDLTSNRISLDAFRQLLPGVGKNKTLKILRIGFNPLTTDGAIDVLRSIFISESAIEDLDLSDILVDDSFMKLLIEVKEKRNIRVKHGVVLRHDEITKGVHTSVLDTDDPMTILFEYMKQKNLRLIDLLHNLDRDHSDTLTRDEFQRGMTSIDLPLSSRALDILMKKLDINQDGQVDFEELTIKHKEYQRRITKLRMKSKTDRKFFKGFDKLEQLREAVRLRIALNVTRESQK